MPEGRHQFKGIRAVPPKPAASAHLPPRNDISPSHAPSQRLKSRPGRDPLGPGSRQSWPLLCRESHLVLGRGRGSQVWLFLWPLGWALVGVASHRGLPHPPSCQGLQVLSLGLTSDSPTPLLHTTCPAGSPRGLQSCPLMPTPTLAGRGKDPRGFDCSRGDPQEVRGLTSSSSPHWLPRPHS